MNRGGGVAVSPGRLFVNKKLRMDPTQTTVLRSRYRAEMNKRFRKVKGLIRKTIVDNNAFDLIDRPPAVFAGPARKFDFPRNSQKIEAFMDWLETAINDEILEVHEWRGGRPLTRNPWQNTYVKTAYTRGIEGADNLLSKVGVDVGRQAATSIIGTLELPIHADSLAMLYTRNFAGLRGVTDAMGKEISRALVDAFSEGLNALDVAKRINGRVDKIGITRARVIARTEIIKAHADATLNRYEQFGIDTVVGMVEFATANVGVCPICQSLEGKIYTIKEARGVIPVHPNCRCTWLPVIQ